jgi:nitrogen regulatory protein PII
MQEIRAYIKPFMLEKVALRLISIPDFPGMSAMNIKGFGKELISKGQEYDPFVEKVRLEIIDPDEMVDSIVTAIMEEAHSGKSGDGKVYITPVGQGYRIRDGKTL